MDRCEHCGVRVTPSDSNAAGVCVNCQEYDYYHGGTQVKYKLFQATLETRDGEHEYTQYQYVLAFTVEGARKFFEAELAEHYEGLEMDEGGYYSEDGGTFEQLVWVKEFTEMTVGLIGGGYGHVDLEVRSG